MEICSIYCDFRINRAKCHVITMNRIANIYFHDGNHLNITYETTYLGNNLHRIIDLKKEISQRIQETKHT